MHQLAAQWIVELLGDRNIPFLICGGLAAKGYGSELDSLGSLVERVRSALMGRVSLCYLYLPKQLCSTSSGAG